MVDLRPAGIGDEDVTRRLDAARDDLAIPLPPVQQRLLRDLQHQARESGWDEQHPRLQRLLIVAGDEVVGRVYLEESDDVVVLVDLLVLPERRDRGHGGAAVDAVVELAGKRPVRLHVTHGNPARRFYERLGFKEVGRDDVRALLARPGSAHA